MSRLARAWRQLDAEQRLAATATLALLLSMFLPWYQQNAVDRAGIVSQDLDAFAVFSVLEASILIAAVGVLALLFVRAEGRASHLAAAEGGVVLGAGCWALLVLVLRLFDKPGVESHGIAADVGVQWGIFFALGAAGLLTYAGARLRTARLQPSPILSARARSARAYGEPEGRRDAQSRRSGPSQGHEDEIGVIASRSQVVREGRAGMPARPPLGQTPAGGRTAGAAQQLSFDEQTRPAATDTPPPDSA